MVLEKTLESPLNSKGIKPVHPKEIKPEYSLEKILMLGKTEGRRITEDEMVGWHHRLDGHEFEQTPGDGEDRGAWCTAMHGVRKSQTRLSD